MRLERSRAIRRELLQNHKDALKNGWAAEAAKFDPKRPWDAVWREMADGQASWWWNKVDQPCMFVSCRVRSVQSYVDGDVVTAEGAAKRSTDNDNKAITDLRHRAPPKKLNTAPLALPYYDGEHVAADNVNLAKHDGVRYTLNKKGK